jgi:hypothetical protein
MDAGRGEALEHTVVQVASKPRSLALSYCTGHLASKELVFDLDPDPRGDNLH